MPRWTTALFLAILATVAGSVDFALRYILEASTTTVFAWWWAESDGKIPVIFCLLLLFGFACALYLWCIQTIHAYVGIPEVYVYLGPKLYEGAYYYRKDDPDRKRFLVPSIPGENRVASVSSLESIYLTHLMIRNGPKPENAERAMAFNMQSRLVSILMQGVMLMFGAAGVGQVAYQYANGHEFTSPSERITTIALAYGTVLSAIYIGGLVAGHRGYRYKQRQFKEPEFERIEDPPFRPGDTIVGHIVDRFTESRDGDTQSARLKTYLLEIPVEGSPTVTAQFAVRESFKTREVVAELDALAQSHEPVPCTVSEGWAAWPDLIPTGQRAFE